MSGATSQKYGSINSYSLSSSSYAPQDTYSKLSQAAREIASKPRQWIQVDSLGNATTVSGVARHLLAEKYGCNHRDLKLIDPIIRAPNASTILVRSRAIFILIENTRVIIERDKATIMDSVFDPVPLAGDSSLVQELISHASPSSLHLSVSSGSGSGGENSVLPFHLRALEAVLGVVVAGWESEVSDLAELTAATVPSHPDAATLINPAATRQCKSGIAQLTERLRRGAKALEGLLEVKDIKELLLPATNLPPTDARTPTTPRKRATPEPPKEEEADDAYPAWASKRGKILALGHAVSTFQKQYDTMVVVSATQEMLECISLQLEMLGSALTALDDRIERAEDQVALELDIRRNQLVLWDLRVTVASMCLALIGAIGAVFGMNLKSGLEESHLAFMLAWVGSIVLAAVVGGKVLIAIDPSNHTTHHKLPFRHGVLGHERRTSASLSEQVSSRPNT